jgi:hypothetical protein
MTQKTTNRKAPRSRNAAAIRLYNRLLTGTPISPTTYAREIGVTRQHVYYLLDVLSFNEVDVVNPNPGEWTLLRFIKDDDYGPQEKTLSR